MIKKNHCKLALKKNIRRRAAAAVLMIQPPTKDSNYYSIDYLRSLTNRVGKGKVKIKTPVGSVVFAFPLA